MLKGSLILSGVALFLLVPFAAAKGAVSGYERRQAGEAPGEGVTVFFSILFMAVIALALGLASVPFFRTTVSPAPPLDSALILTGSLGALFHGVVGLQAATLGAVGAMVGGRTSLERARLLGLLGSILGLCLIFLGI